MLHRKDSSGCKFLNKILVTDLSANLTLILCVYGKREASLAYQGTIGLEIYGELSEHLNFSAASIPIVYQDLEGFHIDPGPGPYAVRFTTVTQIFIQFDRF
jgi:hypothetical protein